MNILQQIIHDPTEILNIVDHMLNTYDTHFYIGFFLVIFCETGLVFLPFLPGDSLLFLAGTAASAGQLHIGLLALILLTAAFLGDNCNYFIGRYIGMKLFGNPKSKIFHYNTLYKTKTFYAKYGSIAIIFARFIPLLRTFTPFVAGIGEMVYKKFITFSAIASGAWIVIFLGGGYYFGSSNFVKNHLSLFLSAFVVIPLIPVLKIIYANFFTKRKLY